MTSTQDDRIEANKKLTKREYWKLEDHGKRKWGIA